MRPFSTGSNSTRSPRRGRTTEAITFSNRFCRPLRGLREKEKTRFNPRVPQSLHPGLPSVAATRLRLYGANCCYRQSPLRVPATTVNASLAKLVRQNIPAVIVSQCELGIEPVFWQNETGLTLGSKA